MIRDQVVDRCASNSLRRRLLRETDLTLEGLLRIARSIEAFDLHAATMEAAAGSSRQQINKISSGFHRPREQHRGNTAARQPRHAKNSKSKNHDTRPVVCFCCGHAGHRAKDPSCPANGKTCSNCGKQGHFGGVCKTAPKQAAKDANSRNVTQQRNGLRYVTTEHDTLDDEYLFAVGGNKEDNTVPITVEGTASPVIIDSGASVNVLDSDTFSELTDKGIILRHSNVKIYPYGSETPLPVKGTFNANVSTPDLHTRANFVVVENLNAGSLLGKKTATELGLLRIGPEYPRTVNQITVQSVQAIVD